MKKVVYTLTVLSFIVFALLPAQVFAFDNEVLVTSTGIEYNISDFEIYIEDFQQANFSTSQQIIDYIYEVGMARCKKRDTQYTIFGKTLTEDEIFLLISHPTYAQNAYDCSQEAITKTRELYPDECQDGARGNAFQHAYWVILMYYDTSPSFAIEFAVAHENYDGNPELHKTMDLYNDYAAYNFCVSLNNDNQDYSITVLKNFARNLKTDGALEYIIFDYEYLHSIVTYRDTMRTVQNYAIGNFYAYTDSDIPYNVPEPQRINLPTDPYIQLG